LKNRSFPKIIEETLRQEFSNSSIHFELTQDGRILLVVNEDDLDLQPHGISDGFYKILFVLTAIETKPSLLLVDEVENSLHREVVELIMDTIKFSEIKSIITTHSPLIVDMIDLNQVRVVSKTIQGTKVTKPKDIEKLKLQLHDLGLTHSDAWYEGVLTGKS